MARACLGLLLVVCWAAPPAWAQTRPFTPVPCPVAAWEEVAPDVEALPGAQVFSGRYAGGLFVIEIPDNWNGELALWAHGAVGLAGPQGARLRVQIPELREHWIARGFAWGASSYRCNGSIYGIALTDTLALREVFAEVSGGRTPSRVYLTGRSLGGRATILGLQEFPDVFAGALAMCAPGQETNDLRVAFRAAAEVIAGFRIEEATLEADLARLREALGDPPALTEAGRRLASVEIAMTGGPRPFAMEGLAAYFLNSVARGASADPEALLRASTNRGIAYAIGDGLGLTAAELDSRARRFEADPALRGPASPYAELQPVTGRLTRPLLTLHGTGDLQVPISQERFLRRAVEASGAGELLVQRIMRIPGHCQFSVAEQVRAFDDLVTWVRDGVRPPGDDVFGDLRDAGRAFTDPFRDGDPGTGDVPR